ncbi:putative bifunctional inhibitor/plant lipid transfer protein/seed storage helical [Helianthus anomalus]
MASKMVGMVLAMVLIVSICGGAMAQSGCTNALMGMSSCLNFITGNTSTPSSSCCSQLGNVVQSQPQCLCQVLNGAGINLGISINRTLALTLPGACNVQTPPVSQCDAANGPPATPTPAASPEGSTFEPNILPESPTESDTPSGSGSKTDGLTPNGSQSSLPLHLLALVMFVVSWASTTTSFGL